MAPTINDLRVLLRRGERQAVSMTLAAAEPTAKTLSFSGGYVVGETMIFLVEPDGLQIHRNPHYLDVLRDGQDVLRRTAHHCWVFENTGHPLDPPVRLTPPGITYPSALAWLLAQHSISRSLTQHLQPAEQITEGEIAGRPTWILREQPTPGHPDPERLVSLEIDQEHGVLLAVETGQEKLEATEITFPDLLPDPTWHGTWQPFPNPAATPATPDPTELPGHLETLPPQSTDPRRLRVFIGEMDLEGSFPDYRTGQSLRLTLAISSLPAPFEGLTTTRRGLVRNLGEHPHPDPEGTPRWPITLTGDGWTALAHTPTPAAGETELQGWFHHSAYGMTDIPTDLLVERIFAGIGTTDSPHRLWQEVDDTSHAHQSDTWRARDAILDVTLDGAVPPPLRRDTFTGLDPVVTGHHLWLCDIHLPVARCWDTTTGIYLGQTLIPAPLTDRYPVLELHTDHTGAIATRGENGWTLTPGQTVATTAPDWPPPTTTTDTPDIPAPWTLSATRGPGLYELHTDTDGRTALGRRNTTGTLDIGELPPTGYTIRSVTQINNKYLVDCWTEEHHLNANLEMIATRKLDPAAPGWRSRGPVAYLPEEDQMRFLDRSSGTELPGVTLPEGHQGGVLAATITSMTVLIYRRNPCHSMSIIPTAVATYDKNAWTTVPLQETPAELFLKVSVPEGGLTVAFVGLRGPSHQRSEQSSPVTVFLPEPPKLSTIHEVVDES